MRIGDVAGYELMERLGDGGMSDVYRAWQPKLEREVAVKVLLRGLAREDRFVEHFQREAKVVASLQHAHIVPIFDYGVSDGCSFLVMPLLRGGTLVQRILRDPSLLFPLIELADIAIFLSKVADALDFAHDRGVVHCDIKPGNILFDERGVPYLADFGIATVLASKTQALERGEMISGSIAYMPPELWQEGSLTGAVDQYALGLVVYAMVTGHPPFGGQLTAIAEIMNKHLTAMPLPVHFLREEADARLDAVIARAIAKKPDERWPSVGAFARAFMDAVLEKEIVVTDDRPPWTLPTRVSVLPAALDNKRITRSLLASANLVSEKIFISYRRQDSQMVTDRLYGGLVTRFGVQCVFRDLNSIPLGVNFKDALDNKIRRCVVMLVVIDRDWLTIQNEETHSRRLDDPNDVVRLEIEAAIRFNIPLIPLLIGRTSMPLISALPLSLAELPLMNGMAMRPDPDFEADMTRLLTSLQYLLD